MNPRFYFNCIFSAVAIVAIAACNDDASGGAGEATAALCTNGVDDDADGFTDCADQDCWQLDVCADVSGPDVSGTDASPTDIAPTDIAPTDIAAPDITATDIADAAAIADVPTTFDCDPCTDKGSIKGRVCAPNQSVHVPNASVRVEGIGCDGASFAVETQSAVDGTYYLLDVPCGSHVLTMRAGSFSSTAPVSVRQGQLLDLTQVATKQCFAANAVRIAVMGGSWDDIGGLIGQLGFRFDFYNDEGDGGADGTIVELLSDRSRLFAYDILFAECGPTAGWLPQDEPLVMPNIKDFVLQGGSLYMSDYAWVLGEWAFPDKVTWYNSDDPNSMGAGSDQSPQVVPSGTRVTAMIVDGMLATYLGKTQIAIEFDQGPQVAPVAVANGAFPHVVGNIVVPLQLNIPNAPLALSYVPAQGAGRVMYTNFHNDAQTTTDMLAILHYLVFRL